MQRTLDSSAIKTISAAGYAYMSMGFNLLSPVYTLVQWNQFETEIEII